MPRLDGFPVLPCPECRSRPSDPRDGNARIGSRRSLCPTCNNFAQNVRRRVWNLLRDTEPDLFAQLRARAEMAQYAGVIAAFDKRYPDAKAGRSVGRSPGPTGPTGPDAR